jgi:steroid delta-isomerase-like uncharacterized protein
MTDPADVVRSFWQDLWCLGKTESLLDIISVDATENGEPLNLESFEQGIIAWRRKFPDFTVTIEELAPLDGERVVSRVTYRGTQREPCWGVPPTGRSFEVIGIDIFRVQEGRIVELWHSVDHLQLAFQIGAKLVPKDD